MDFGGSELSPQEAQAYIRAHSDIQLIDVRTPEEHRQARLAGSRLISVQALPVRAHELDRERPLLLYCASGGRSGMALDFLRQQGFGQAKHIAGGIMAWAEHGLPYQGPS